jgi:hypothetical protein
MVPKFLPIFQSSSFPNGSGRSPFRSLRSARTMHYLGIRIALVGFFIHTIGVQSIHPPLSSSVSLSERAQRRPEALAGPPSRTQAAARRTALPNGSKGRSTSQGALPQHQWNICTTGPCLAASNTMRSWMNQETVKPTESTYSRFPRVPWIFCAIFIIWRTRWHSQPGNRTES